VGVGEDFQTFKDNYNITQELIGSISYRYKRITRQLNTDFWNTDSETGERWDSRNQKPVLPIIWPGPRWLR
jgi:hypothetical protein